MTKTPSLGEFEQIVLLAVLRLGENAYGVTILGEIAERTARNASPGALYTTLHRMEDKGLVTFRDGSPTPERGGRAKRFVTVTREGRDALATAQAAYRSLMEGLDLLSPTHAQKARVNGPPVVRGARFTVQAGFAVRGAYA
jgi:PadR family transcriptional regulator, regulatory protein PadR